MHLFESAFALRKPILIGAFEGWNDAAESASGAIEHLLTVWSHHRVAKLDSEDYYDYQVNRPHIRVDEKVVREIVWPNTTVYEVSLSPAPERTWIFEPTTFLTTFFTGVADATGSAATTTGGSGTNQRLFIDGNNGNIAIGNFYPPTQRLDVSGN
ncbi:MAG: PAC2 family protein, partial [Actinobacteria bacterium]|nr:PAC2 family protein [Actinomycetota bacterium]